MFTIPKANQIFHELKDSSYPTPFVLFKLIFWTKHNFWFELNWYDYATYLKSTRLTSFFLPNLQPQLPTTLQRPLSPVPRSFAVRSVGRKEERGTWEWVWEISRHPPQILCSSIAKPIWQRAKPYQNLVDMTTSSLSQFLIDVNVLCAIYQWRIQFRL